MADGGGRWKNQNERKNAADVEALTDGLKRALDGPRDGRRFYTPASGFLHAGRRSEDGPAHREKPRTFFFHANLRHRPAGALDFCAKNRTHFMMTPIWVVTHKLATLD